MIAVMEPLTAPTQLAGWKRAPCPVVAVLVPAVKGQTSPLLSPKGTDPRTLKHFACKLAASWGPRRGHDGDDWTLRAAPRCDVLHGRPGPRHAADVMVGEGHAPLWQYLLRS